MKDIYDQLKESDLTEDLQMVAGLCGMETVRVLMRHFAGMNVYVPKLTRLEQFIRRYLENNSDKTYKQAAFELNVSEMYLRKLRKKLLSGK